MATIHETNALINSTVTKPITDVTKLDPNKTYDLTAEGYVEHKDPLKEKWYTVGQAAKEIGKTKIAIATAIRGGFLLCKEIPGHSPTGYIRMISETALTEYLEDPTVIRNPKGREEYLAKAREDQKERYRKSHPNSERRPAYKNDIPRPDVVETSVNLVDIREMEGEKQYARDLKESYPIDDKLAVKLDVLMAHIQALVHNAYENGYEDGKKSVDISEQYNRGVEEGKKQAKEELLAVLKGV